jgi:hypothetical protein
MDSVDAKTQFQHHVPQFYLRGWQTSVANIPKRVWVYSRGQAPRNSAIRRVGGRENTYAVIKSDGTLDVESVEKYLAEVESRAGKVFPKILKHEPLSVSEKRVIATFVSVMYRRDIYTLDAFAPQKLAPMIPGLQMEMLEQAKLVASNPELHEKYVVAVNKAIELAKENLSSITSQSILNSEPMGSFFAKLNWAFMTTKTSEFVTSDTPIVFDRFRGIRAFATGQILLPISSSIILWMTQWPIASNIYFRITDGLVASINEKIIRNSFQEVYANVRSIYIQRTVDEQMGAGLPEAAPEQ